MAFTEDLDNFFDTDEFAVDATVNSYDFKVIFDEPTQGVEGLDASIEETHPSFHCKTADLTAAAAKRNDTATVDGNDFTIAAIRKDGQGTSTVWLK